MKCKLKSIANVNLKNLNKSDKFKEIQYLDTANLTEGKIDTLVDIDLNVDKVPSRAKRRVSHNDILISTVRPNQKHYGIIKNPSENLIVSTGFSVITANEEVIDPDYLYALLTTSEVTSYLQAIAENSTSTYPAIKASDIENLNLNLQSIDKQRKIGNISVTILDKIELNNQMIDTLEEIASTLFKRWFVDFEFPDENGNPYKSSGGKMMDSELGEIPEGWEVGKLSDYGTIVGGGTPSKKIEKYYENGVIPWITPKDLSELRTHFISKGKLNITDEALKKSSAKLLPKGTVLFSSRAPIGYMAIAKNELSTNQGFKSVVPNENMSSYFIFLWLKENLELIKNFGTGSTFKEVSGGTMKNIDVVIPNQSFITQFNSLIKPFFKLVETAETENSKLISIRDILLPKLLSGEIEV